jgi:hypothetical protein
LELTMPEDHSNLAEENERHRRYLADTFGENVLVGLGTDQTSGKHTTAHTLAKDSLAARRERQQAEDVELVAVAAREQDEDEALDTALRVMRRGGGKTPPGTMRKAARALTRRGYHQGSTAERLARMAGQGQGWRPAS